MIDKNGSIWRVVLPVVIATIIAVLPAMFTYGQLSNKVEMNCKQVSDHTEAITQIRIQQGRMDTKLETIAEGVSRIEKKIEKNTGH